MHTSRPAAPSLAVVFAVVLCACAPETPVDVSGVTKLELELTFCGAAFGACQHMKSRVVDLAHSTFEQHTCVERTPDAGVSVGSPKYGPERDDLIQSRALTPAEVDSIRHALDGLRFARAPITFFDGAMTALTLSSPIGVRQFSPEAACGDSPFNQLIGGLQALESVVNAL